ncbi:hypothetical protein G9A89_009553 [Geosiphon pyriformis]|nr:hypothetical protein G9A89_009553 [Geosiphon pyriformis]
MSCKSSCSSEVASSQENHEFRRTEEKDISEEVGGKSAKYIMLVITISETILRLVRSERLEFIPGPISSRSSQVEDNLSWWWSKLPPTLCLTAFAQQQLLKGERKPSRPHSRRSWSIHNSTHWVVENDESRKRTIRFRHSPAYQWDREQNLRQCLLFRGVNIKIRLFECQSSESEREGDNDCEDFSSSDDNVAHWDRL